MSLFDSAMAHMPWCSHQGRHNAQQCSCSMHSSLSTAAPTTGDADDDFEDAHDDRQCKRVCAVSTNTSTASESPPPVDGDERDGSSARHRSTSSSSTCGSGSATGGGGGAERRAHKRGGMLRFADWQLAVLRNKFEHLVYLMPAERQRIAAKLSLSEEQVRISRTALFGW